MALAEHNKETKKKASAKEKDKSKAKEKPPSKVYNKLQISHNACALFNDISFFLLNHN